MTDAWRLTRNPYGRRVYDALKRAGVTATWMTEYRRPLDAPARPAAPLGTDVSVVEPERVTPLEAPVHELRNDEVVVAATAAGTPVGYLFCSAGTTHRVAPLERRLSFDGAYVRRVFVAPDHRRRGVASALVGAACAWAAERGAASATALVARDNAPSRTLFERQGFAPERERLYVRLGPVSYRSVRNSPAFGYIDI